MASEHDAVAGTQRGANVMYAFTLDGVRSRTSATSASRSCAASRPRRWARSTCCSSRSGAGRRSAPRSRTRSRHARRALGRADALPHAPHQLPRARGRVRRALLERGAARDGELRARATKGSWSSRRPSVTGIRQHVGRTTRRNGRRLMAKVVYTAKANVTGGRANGHGVTDDGALDIQLRPPTRGRRHQPRAALRGRLRRLLRGRDRRRRPPRAPRGRRRLDRLQRVAGHRRGPRRSRSPPSST